VIYLALGRREQGKTTLGYSIISKLPRRLVFDPRGMIRNDKGIVFSRTGPAFDTAMDRFDAHEIRELVFTPAGNVNSAFAVFCREAANFVRRNPDDRLGILIDEIRFVDLKNEDLDWILRCSSVDSVHVVLTGHRPKDVPTDIRAIADRWLLFSFTLPRDLEIIDEQCSPRVAVAVTKLQARQFVTWDDRIGQASSHSDPTVWYIETKKKRADSAAPVDTLPPGEPGIDKGSLFP